MVELTPLQRELLAFEAAYTRWKHGGAKDEEIRRRWDMSPARYAQVLNHLIDLPAAEAYDPRCVRRLRRLRAERQAARRA